MTGLTTLDIPTSPPTPTVLDISELMYAVLTGDEDKKQVTAMFRFCERARQYRDDHNRRLQIEEKYQPGNRIINIKTGEVF